MKEVEEPFGKSQIGSSAMAYKRNPMRSERVCSLARYLIGLPQNCAHMRISGSSEHSMIVLFAHGAAEAFLSADVILTTCINIADGLHVWPAVIKQHLNLELPFMATEVILMDCVKAGGDRQELHEAIREHSMAAGKRVKEEGATNDLLERIAKDPLFASIHDKLDSLVDANAFVGRAPRQVDDFLEDVITPILASNSLVEITDCVNV